MGWGKAGVAGIEGGYEGSKLQGYNKGTGLWFGWWVHQGRGMVVFTRGVEQRTEGSKCQGYSKVMGLWSGGSMQQGRLGAVEGVHWVGWVVGWEASPEEAGGRWVIGGTPDVLG